MAVGDVQAILVGIVVIIVLTLLVWLIMSCTVRELSFEERMKQKHRIEAELNNMFDGKQQSQKKDKDKLKKKKKKAAPKTTDSASSSPQSAPEKSDEGTMKKEKKGKMVELEIEPQVFETAQDEPVAAAGKKKKSTGKVTPSVTTKPILLNRGEKSSVADEATELVHRKIVPKDALELKHERERRKSVELHEPVLPGVNGFHTEVQPKPAVAVAPATGTGSQHLKGHSEHSKESKVVLVEPPSVDVAAATGKAGKGKKQHREPELVNGENLVETSVKMQMTAAAPTLSSTEQQPKKKNKNNAPAVSAPQTVISPEVERLIELAEKTSFSDFEAQRLVEVLCVKLPSNDAAELLSWSKKGQKDSPQVVSKQLEDKKREVEEEKLRTQAANERVKELMLEAADLRQKVATFAKQNVDQVASQRQETAQVAARLQQQETAATMLRAQLETLKVQLTESHNELQRTKAENIHLASSAQQHVNADAMLDEMRQKVKIMDDALKSNVVKYNQCENVRKSLENNAKLYEEKIGHLENSLRESQLMVQRYSEAPEELHKLQVHNKSLAMDIERLTASAQRIEKELIARSEELKFNENKLHDISRQKSEAEGRLRLAESEIMELSNTARQKDTEIQALIAQLNEVQVELKLVKETPVRAGGDVNAEIPRMAAVLAESAPAAGDAEELSKVSAQLQSALDEAKAARDEIERLRQEVADKVAELDALKKSLTEDRPVSENASAEVQKIAAELEQKNAELETLKTEIETLQRDNQVLRDCEEMKSSLLMLNNQLRDMETDRVAGENRLREKESAVVQLENELAQTKTSLAEVSQNLAEKEAEVARIGGLLQQKEAEIGRSAESNAEKANADAEERLKQKESERADIESRLSAKEAELADVQSRLSQKDAERADIESQLRAKETSFLELEARSSTQGSETASRLQDLEEKNETLRKELESLGEQLASARNEKEKIDAELAKSKSAVEELRGSSGDAGRLQSELERRSEELTSLRTELEQLRAANESLQKLVGDMKTEAESRGVESSAGSSAGSTEVEELRTRVEQQTHEISRLTVTLETTIKTHETVYRQVRETLVRILPGVQLEGDWQERSEWLVELEKRATQSVQSEATDDSRITELQSQLDVSKQSEDKLTFQVQHYKTVLSDTEAILKKLQETVETEEQKYVQKLQLSENQLTDVKEELKSVRDEMKGMHVTAECFARIAPTPSVDRTESTLRRDGSPGQKPRLSIAELTGGEEPGSEAV